MDIAIGLAIGFVLGLLFGIVLGGAATQAHYGKVLGEIDARASLLATEKVELEQKLDSAKTHLLVAFEEVEKLRKDKLKRWGVPDKI